MRIEIIDKNSPHLNTVKNLWRSNSDTLGFFPDGAFNDYASKRQILVALDSENNCVGYILYRWSGNSVAIVHLCIDKSFRNKGIAKELVNNLIKLTKKCIGIGLRCRRAYEANKIWPNLGFVAQSELEGKNKEGIPLTFWWYDHGHPNLFTFSTQQLLGSKICVVIDANVFFDLQNDLNPDSEESKSLTADWLSNIIELCITDETYNEIHRGNDCRERESQRDVAKSYPILPYDTAVFKKIFPQLRRLLPAKISESDRSDLRQLARTVASEVQYFVTRDTGLLNLSNEIYELCKVTVVRPSDLIVHVDELQRESEYQPIRLAGTDIKIRLVQKKQEEILTNHFLCHSYRESKSSFQKLLRKFISNPSLYSCQVVSNKDNQLLALIVYFKPNDSELEIPLFRAGNKPLSPTIIRHLILNILSISSKENRTIIRITDPYLNDNVLNAVQQDNFINIEKSWIRISLPLAETSSLLADRFRDPKFCLGTQKTKEILMNYSNILINGNAINDSLVMITLEKILWPLKIVDANIPNFIIAIKPIWAKELFDENLAKQHIFGPKTELALQRESVYYRSKRPSIVKAPGRILWYVSDDKSYRYPGPGKIRAASLIDEVIVGKPKELFRRFRRLGVYEWEDVYELAKSNINNDIMAIKFCDTELFEKPIPWEVLKDFLNKNGIKSNIQSPIRIPNSVFEYLYKSGKNYC